MMDNIWFCMVFLPLKINQIQTPGWYSTNAPMFQCWRSTNVARDLVIIYIFYYSVILHIYHGLPHSSFFTYSLYFCLLCHNLVGCVPPVHNHIQSLWISSSLVCHSSVLHTGPAASCASGHNRALDDTLWDAKRISWLSRRLLRLNKGQQWQMY
jgi:hypothetical protein